MRALSAPQRAFFKSQHASPPFFARIFQPTPFSFATLPTPSFSCTRLSEHFPARRPRIHCNRRHNAHDSNLFGAQKKPRVHRPQLFNFSVFRDRRFPLFASSGRLPAFGFLLPAFSFLPSTFKLSAICLIKHRQQRRHRWPVPRSYAHPMPSGYRPYGV